MSRLAELREHGFRRTPQRAIILEILEESSRHLTAAEIVAEVEKQRLPLNPSTVYRTLETLVEIGIVKPSRMGRATYYELKDQGDDHHHLVCTNCRSTVHLPGATVDGLLARGAAKAGFEVSEIQVLVSGLCPRCRGKRSSR